MALSQDLRRTRPQQQELSQFWQSVGSDPNDIRLPSGFDRDSLGWEPGRVMSQEEVQKVWENLHTGYKDFGLDFNTYLNDPRSAIRQENGQYVYRPENVTDYWAGINDGNFGFADLAKGFLTTPSIMAPLMAIGGGILGAEGIIGSAAGQMGSSSFPTFLGDAAAGLGGEGLGSLAGMSDAQITDFFRQNGVQGVSGDAAHAYGGMSAGDEFLNTMSEFVPGGQGAAEAAAAAGSWSPLDVTESVMPKPGTPGWNSYGLGATSPIGRILSGQGNIDDYLGAAGLIGGTALGIKGANDQQDATKQLYDNFYGMGQPYRDSLATLNSNPSSFYSSPQYQGALDYGTQAVGKALSAKGGNPWGNETSKQAMLDFSGKFGLDAYNQRWNQLSSAGQLGLGATPGLGLANAQAQGGIPNAIGAGIAGLTTPTYNLGDIVGEDEIVARRRANEARRNSYPTWMNP
jgi:hypothetical protein